MSDMFYRAFEDRHRGSRELILSRLSAYKPFLQPLKDVDTERLALDFGCGRGEWLELTGQQGFSAIGVDIDEGMLAECQKLGLHAINSDAIEYLEALEPESCVLVSAFHVVEHISFEALRQFVEHALRVLKPGGLLIMETPNPENILVATHNFYLDPTHQKPIPSELLSFVTEYAGFQRVKTLGLQEPEKLASKQAIDLRDVFWGVSPDYAIVAQKGASPAVMGAFDAVFDSNYGMSLDTLLARRDQRLQSIEQMVEQAQASASSAEAKASQAEANAVEAQASASSAEAKASQAEAKAIEAQATNTEIAALLSAETAHVHALMSSTSWRVTAPLRFIGNSARQLKAGGLWRNGLRLLIRHGALYVSRRPRLRKAALSVLSRFPLLKARLRNVGFGQVESPQASPQPLPGVAQLTLRGQQIYSDLNAAVESDSKDRG